MYNISELKPEAVFGYFQWLCSVPHGSGNTKHISDLCIRMAKELGLSAVRDAETMSSSARTARHEPQGR